ncbi:DUF7344 domain-containing protein [Natrinema marinum]|uniref:DUF7344 domain-containing protein n=1 Tax=Natrinema marinum TaxID=2961598 RepID=UPI0020C888FB|nr:hypothetical protein [Natrinema marinum]
MLADHRRRAVLAYFRNSPDDIASVRDLANELEGDDHREDRVALRHSVLPRLSDANVIEYDERSETIRYQGHASLECLADLIAEF